MKQTPLAVLVFLIPAIVAGSIASAEVELTPSLGLRFGGAVESDAGSDNIDPALSFGLTLDLPLAPEKWIAVIWSHQRSEFSAPGLLPNENSFGLDIDYFQAGGVYRPNPEKKTQPFVMVTAGFTWIRPEPPDFGDEFGISAMVGGGAKFVLSPKIGLRLEGRGYATFTSVTLSGVCGGVGCSVRFTSGGFLQFEGLGGVTFSF